MSGCRFEIIEEETPVYFNDFSGGALEGLGGNPKLWQFNGKNVLGPYNRDGFSLTLNNLPKHRIISISIDLYIHDTWDGNKIEPDGPDLWKVLVDDKVVFETTFLNSPCESIYCPQQSYPDQYLSFNNPRTDVFDISFPGQCWWDYRSDGTNLYRVQLRIGHSASSIEIRFADELVQLNVINPSCDESWSVGSIYVGTISVK
jgi:hypothetical protein